MLFEYNGDGLIILIHKGVHLSWSHGSLLVVRPRRLWGSHRCDFQAPTLVAAGDPVSQSGSVILSIRHRFAITDVISKLKHFSFTFSEASLNGAGSVIDLSLN